MWTETFPRLPTSVARRDPRPNLRQKPPRPQRGSGKATGVPPCQASSILSPCVTSVLIARRRPGSSPAFRAAMILV